MADEFPSVGRGLTLPVSIGKVVRLGEPLRLLVEVWPPPAAKLAYELCVGYLVAGSRTRDERCVGTLNGPFVIVGPSLDR